MTAAGSRRSRRGTLFSTSVSTLGYDPARAGSVVAFGRRLAGRRLRDVMHPTRLKTWQSNAANKGDMGHAVEHYFGIVRNSESSPDIQPAGVEVKVVPIHHVGGWNTVKERCFLSQVPWEALEASEPFQDSGSDVKSRSLLLVFYEWVKHQDPLDTTVLAVALWRRDAIVTDAFQQAWSVTADRVRASIADQTSAGDTPIVGASTKGGGSWQPASGGPPVKARAWAIKQDYMQRLLRDLTDLQTPTPNAEAYGWKLRRSMARFRGWRADDIARRVVGYKSGTGAKHYVRLVVDRLLPYLEDLEDTGGVDIDQLERLGITIRATRVALDAPSGHPEPAEDLSFAPVAFSDIADHPFDDSTIARRLRTIVLLVFTRERSIPASRYVDTVVWRLTEDELSAAADDYRAIRLAIKKSDIAGLPKGQAVALLRLGTKSSKASAHQRQLPNGELAPQRSFYVVARRLGPVLGQLLALPYDLQPQPVTLFRDGETPESVRPR